MADVRNRDRRGRWIVLAILLVSHVLAGLAVWAFPESGLFGGVAAGTGAAGSRSGASDDDVPKGPRARLRGQVWLEPLPFADEDEGRDEADTEDEGGEGTDTTTAAGDGEPDATADGAARSGAGELAPPDPGRCRFAAWQQGRRVGTGHGCEPGGAYELTLAPGVHGAVALEVLVSRRLRAVLEVDVPAPPADAGPDAVLEPVTVEPVALGLGYVVAGVVTDARGAPVPHVIVEARPNPDLDEPEPWRAETDDDGAFVFDTLPEGPLALRVDHRDYDVSVVETVAPEGDVLIVVSELIDLRGRVIAAGEDLSKAKVRIEGSSLWPPVEHPVQADGTFVLERLPDGIYGIEVVLRDAAGGGARSSYPTENVTPDLTLDLGLLEAHYVPVEVVEVDGTPVPGARVRVGYASVGMLQKLGSADDVGLAHVGPVVPGPYVVSADANGYLPAVPAEIELPPGGFDPDADPVRLVLARPGRIAGKVVDEEGQPVADAEVTVESDELFVAGEAEARARLFTTQLQGKAGAAGRGGGGPATGSLGVTKGKVPDIPLPGEADDEFGVGVVLTEDDGRFVVEGLVPGRYVLRARHGDHAGSPPTTIDLASGESREGVVLRLREGVLLTGRVLDGNGQPVPMVSITFDDGLTLLTDAQGSFDAGHHRGKVPLVVRADGYAPRRVVVKLGQRPVDLDLTLEAADGQVEGRLVDGNGRPVADAAVLIRPRDGLSPAVMVETDDQGVYAALGLPRGEVEIEVEHPDFVARTYRRPAAPQLGALEEFELVEGWALEVEVVEAATGDPVPRAAVRLAGTGGTTDKGGRVSLNRLSPGPAELEVAAPGFVPLRVSLSAKETASGAQVVRRVELTQGGGMSGTVTDDVGDDVFGARVRIRGPGGALLAETQTARDGTWSVAGLPEGDVVVHVDPPKALIDIVRPAQMSSDVLRGRVTREVDVRFDRL